MKTRGTDNHPTFDFQTPLVVPQGSVGLVNVEGFFGMTPSLFHSDYMYHPSNVFTRTKIIDNSVTNLWTDENARATFIRCRPENMANPKNVAYFLFDFLASNGEANLCILFPILSYTLDS
jgi:hypothetical protein